jgi:hypothetical protein
MERKPQPTVAVMILAELLSVTPDPICRTPDARSPDARSPDIR